MTRSLDAFQRAQRVVPGGSMRQSTWFSPHPPYAMHGEGCRVVDLDGRAIVDCANNFFSLIHGHAFPPVVEAIRDVVGRGTAFGMPTEPFAFSNNAVGNMGPAKWDRARFEVSGATAQAIRIR